MARTEKDTPAKERKPARTIEERIAELQAKADAKAAKDKARANKTVDAVKDKIAKLEARLGDLYTELEAAQAVLGDAAVEAPAEVVEDTTT